MDPKIISRDKLVEIIENAGIRDLVLCIEKAYTSYSLKEAIVPPVGTLTFKDPPGDVHIKYGYITSGENYVIKIASGFYNNPNIGLSSSNGLNLVFNQRTGILKTILLDEGYLTDVRTALGGTVASKYLAPRHPVKLGIMGTGIQARLQLKYISEYHNLSNAMIWGRSEEKLASFKKVMQNPNLDIECTNDINRIIEACNLIVTTTPATSPILTGENIMDGTLIIAIGADTEGKQEIDFPIIKRADHLVLDSYSQCKSHGEIHKAFRAGMLRHHSMVELGEIISDNGFVRNPGDVIIADLTGIATQDIQISNYVLTKLK